MKEMSCWFCSNRLRRLRKTLVTFYKLQSRGDSLFSGGPVLEDGVAYILQARRNIACYEVRASNVACCP